MIKQKSFKPYPIEILPDGFIYPARYLQLANCTNTVQSDEYFQWWFEDSDSEGAKLAYLLRNNKIKDFNLHIFQMTNIVLNCCFSRLIWYNEQYTIYNIKHKNVNFQKNT